MYGGGGEPTGYYDPARVTLYVQWWWSQDLLVKYIVLMAYTSMF